jgi:hypothetical protein
VLRELGVDFGHFDILDDDVVREGLKASASLSALGPSLSFVTDTTWIQRCPIWQPHAGSGFQ